MMEFIIFSTALILISLLIVFLTYSGWMSTIDIQVTEVSTPGTFFYKFYQQSYSECSLVLRELFKFPVIKNDSKLKCMGIYYDDPKKIENNKTRYAIGLFVPSDEISDELKNTMTGIGYSHVQLPPVKAIVAEFPFQFWLSILVAIYRVYPKLKTYCENQKLNAHPYLEVYDQKTIFFVAPLEKNELFYVDEYKYSSID
uniref:Testis-expressed sequence 264 protein n=1 Tax=Hydra vulgaris TaxID=6087 RepID=T2M2H3_HYDVU